MLLWSLVVVAAAIATDSGNFYVVQFDVPISTELVVKLARAIGYEPDEYVPRNALVVWLDAARFADPAHQLPALVPHIAYVGVVERAHRTVDIRGSLAAMRVQQRRTSGVVVAAASNGSRPETVGAVYDDAFERDASGSLVVQLLVKMRDSLRDEQLRTIASAHSRTITTITKAPTVAAQRSHGVKSLLLGNVHCDDAERVTRALLADQRVIWVELRAPHQAFNRWGVPSLLYEAGSDQRTMPRRALLRGSGELLSMSDTGVEVSTCLFRDSANRAVPFTSVQTVPPDTGHERIRAYWSGTGGDFRDAGSGGGHGTHVAATAIGRSTAAITGDYSGGAPDARLVFADLLPLNGGRFLQVPLRIDATLFQYSLDNGAFVHSASWGSVNGGAYGTDEEDADRFAFEHRDFLIVFAAGNEGPDLATIASPAYAKNVLAIGATMNGAAAYELAGHKATPADDYSHDWLADFSSCGSPQLALRKPELVAPGGQYVWSANSDAPTGAACTATASVLAGIYGTSMATPLVASGALLVREYFVDGRYPNSVGITTAGDTRRPKASLVRAMLIASAVPLRGMFPHRAFASTAERVARSGFGRVALERVLELSTNSGAQTVVLSNERTEHGLQEGRAALWCVELAGVAAPGDQLIVALSYADYPSSPLARTTLINDLRLDVFLNGATSPQAVNDLAVNARELRSTNERVVLSAAQATTLNIRVVADDIGFGQVQTFALVLILRKTGGSAMRVASVSAPLIVTAAAEERCGRCTAAPGQPPVFVPRSQCTLCGNGLVEVPAEECDGSECCDPATCRILADNSPCSVVVNGCRIQGTCRGRNQLCVADARVKYVNANDGSGNCLPTVSPPTPPTPSPGGLCMTKSVNEWHATLLTNRAVAGDRRLCCSPLWAIFDMIEFEPLFVALAREYAAAVLNSLQPGAVVGAQQLMEIGAAGEFLERYCSTGLIDPVARVVGEQTKLTLRAANRVCGGNAVAPPQCATKSAALSKLLCSNDGGTYDRQSDACVCNADRQNGEPDCAHLSCSGNGASVYDHERQSDACVCLEGWSGAACDQCAAAPSTDVAYHCVGVSQAVLGGSIVQRHYLQLVQRSSVAARLEGTYYRGASKVADGVPGWRSLDCWCRMPGDVPNAAQFKTHRAALAAAQAQYNAMLTLAAYTADITDDEAPRKSPASTAHHRQQHAVAAQSSSSTRVALPLSALVALLLFR